MKKFLLSIITFGIISSVSGQVLFSENFEALNVGNLGTDVTGVTPGQNSWLTLNGSNASYQVANIDASHGKSLSIIGNNTFDTANPSTQNTRIAAKISASTPVPTVGNNILQGKFDLYTGAASNGIGTIQMRIWGVDGTTARTIGGFQYNVANGVLTALATVNNTGTTGTPGPTTYSWGLAAAPGLVLAPNTWVTLEFRYNMTTGAFTFFYPGGSGTLAGAATYALIPGMVAEDLYLYNVAAPGNTSSKTASFDNIMVQFSNQASLSTNEIITTAEDFTIFPNPTSEILYVKGKNKIKNISVYDLSGKKLPVKFLDGSIDVRHLESGTYLLEIQTSSGKQTKKFIKK